MFEWLHSGWLQGIAIILVMIWYGNFIDKEHRKAAEDAQAKIERIWEQMSKLEDKIYKQTEWAIAASKKMVYDADRRRLVEQIEEKYKPEIKEGESWVDVMIRHDNEVREVAYKRYPKKEIEDFMK